MPHVVVPFHLRYGFEFIHEEFVWGLEVKYSARIVVNPCFDVLDCSLCKASDISPFSNESTDESVRILVGSTFP